MNKSTVVCIACPSYDKYAVKDAVYRGLSHLGNSHQFAAQGENLLIKPNLLLGAPPEKAVTTHPEVFGAVAESFVQSGAKIFYGDSPGIGNIQKQFQKAGYFEITRKLGLQLSDFTTRVPVAYPHGKIVKTFLMAKGVTDSDGLISISKLKPHGFLRLTGAVKNQFGCIPGFLKPEYHFKMPDPFQFSTMLIDLNRCIKPRLYIMDAITAMEGNGPRGGTPCHVGALLFSTDPVALDTVACHLIHLNPTYVPTIVAGSEQGLGISHLSQITLLGDDISPLRKPDYKIIRKPVISQKSGWLGKTLKKQLTPKPAINFLKCSFCGTCMKVCPAKKDALFWSGESGKSVPEYNYRACIRCFCCQEMCPESAINIQYPWLNKLLIHRE